MKVILIQRIVPHYRVDLFNEVSSLFKSKNVDFKVFCGKSIGKTKFKNGELLPDYVKVCLKGNTLFAEKIKLYYNLFIRLWAEKPNIIVTEGGANTINNIQVYIYSKLFGVPYIIWDLGKFANLRKEKNKLLEYVYFEIYKRIIKNCKSILTYNKMGANYFHSNFNIPFSNIQILHNTINEEAIFNSKIDSAQDGNFTKFADKYQNIIIFVGAINYEKNMDFLITLQNNLSEGYAFVLVGGGVYKEPLKQLMNPERTYFAGQVTDLNRLAYYYSRSKLFILPGLGGLSINQSLAFGVPVLCSEADGSEYDLIINGKTGFVLPKDDIQSWIEKIEFISSFDKKYFYSECINHIKNNFSLKAVANNFVTPINI